jgi:SAM-dependent methyltransferase
MMHQVLGWLKESLTPLHPTWQSKQSRNRVLHFLAKEEMRSPNGLRLNVGSGNRRFKWKVLNLDLFLGKNVDIQGDLIDLPLKDESADTIICTGVLEHVSDPHKAVDEIYRALKFGGKVFLETPFMQTLHAAPNDFSRWTAQGAMALMKAFDVNEVNVVAGPASAFAWQFQETMAMLFSFNSEALYKIGLRVFGLLAVPLSWLDVLLEGNPKAGHAASGFALVALKSLKKDDR